MVKRESSNSGWDIGPDKTSNGHIEDTLKEKRRKKKEYINAYDSGSFAHYAESSMPPPRKKPVTESIYGDERSIYDGESYDGTVDLSGGWRPAPTTSSSQPEPAQYVGGRGSLYNQDLEDARRREEANRDRFAYLNSTSGGSPGHYHRDSHSTADPRGHRSGHSSTARTPYYRTPDGRYYYVRR